MNWIALIRAIGPLTHKKMSMADLRFAAEANGFCEVRTLLATGNLLFSSDLGANKVRAQLEDILVGCGLELPGNAVFLLTPEDVAALMVANPFAEAAKHRPSKLLFVATTHPLDQAATTRIAAWDMGPERLAAVECGLFIDYCDGIGTSKLTPKRLEKLIGQPGTGRNWNTLGKLVA
jgi:uncharacterized protein (DUF1697 family)